MDDRATQARAPRIIVAEDDPEMRGLLSVELRLDGYLVVQVADGLRLEDELAATLPPGGAAGRVDLVITDVHLPGQSGLAAVARLRPQLLAVPVIVITAYGDEETHAAARRLGVAAVFDKPFDVDELRALVRRLVPPA